jgi:phosphosulfolactate synthase
LDHGAEKVIIEGRESGKNIGVYDNKGNILDKKVKSILEGINHRQNDIIWEAPQQHQQASFIQRFGSNVNLGNILPRDILGLEALRQGLRYETLVHFVSENKLKNE